MGSTTNQRGAEERRHAKLYWIELQFCLSQIQNSVYAQCTFKALTVDLESHFSRIHHILATLDDWITWNWNMTVFFPPICYFVYINKMWCIVDICGLAYMVHCTFAFLFQLALIQFRKQSSAESMINWLN